MLSDENNPFIIFIQLLILQVENRYANTLQTVQYSTADERQPR